MSETTRQARNEGLLSPTISWRTISAVIVGTILGILLAMWLGELGESVFSNGWSDKGI